MTALLGMGCAGSGGGADLPGPVGDVLKISYYRPNPNPRTKRPEPTYRVVMSISWQNKVGESPREPLIHAAPGKKYRGFSDDHLMRKFFEDLRRNGLFTLRASAPESYRPDDLYRKALDPKEFDSQGASFTRIITVGTDEWHKSYYYRDQQFGKESIETFRKCEMLVSQMVQWSILVETGADPLKKDPLKDR